MKFVRCVQTNDIAWPTSRKFDVGAWRTKAKDLAEDTSDESLAMAGVWVADTFGPIRAKIFASLVGDLSLQDRARFLFALCNHDYALMMYESQSGKIPLNVPSIFVEEYIHQSINDRQDLWGSRKASDLLETEIDSIELSLRHNSSTLGYQNLAEREILSELRRIINLGSGYLTVEEIFQRTVWLDWRILDEDSSWVVSPANLNVERAWEASYQRFADLGAQLESVSIEAWRRYDKSRRLWIEEARGTPRFDVKRHKKVYRVSYRGRDMAIPAFPPHNFVSQLIANESYYRPLIERPLPALSNRTVLDLLNVWSLLQQIAEMLVESIPQEKDIYSLPQLVAIYSPAILQDTVVAAFSRALLIDEDTISCLIEALTWSPSNDSTESLWFRPVVTIGTKQGRGMILSFCPLLIPNLTMSN